jgi:hypothetical protein
MMREREKIGSVEKMNLRNLSNLLKKLEADIVAVNDNPFCFLSSTLFGQLRL